jgi:ATP-binding cassette, subfamily B, bacterial
MSFSFRVAPRQATLFLLCAVIMSLASPVMAFGSKLLVDAAIAHDTDRSLAVAAALSLFAALSLVNVLNYVDFMFSVVEKAGAAIDRGLMELIAGVPGLEHHERPDYLDRLDTLREERAYLPWMTNATAGMIRVAVQLAASGVLLARLNLLLLLLPIAGFASFLLGRRGQALQLQAFESTAEPERLRRHLFETAASVGTANEVRIFGLAGNLIDRHHGVSDAVMRERDRADWRGAALQTLDGLISGAAYVGAIGLVMFEAIHGRATPGDVVLAVGLAAGMNSLVFTAVAYGTHFLRVLRIAQRFLWLADYAEEAKKASPNPAAVPQSIRQGIDLHDVSFKYPGTDALVLDRISLHLPPGSVVALVGENGAGKTTLAKLLSRFYEPTSGTIEVDGIELNRFDVQSWRQHIAAAFQDFSRFELLAR